MENRGDFRRNSPIENSENQTRDFKNKNRTDKNSQKESNKDSINKVI